VPTRANIDIAAALAEAEGLYRERNPKSLGQHREACAAMPGGNTRSAIHVDPFPLTIVRGEGARLWDIDGHEYVDFLSEFTAGIFGHSHPAIREAIEAALDQGLNFGAHNATEARFAAAICARFPSIGLVRFTNSGTEANLMAVSAARAITGRPKILVFKGGYHGGVFYFRGHGSLLNAPFEFLLGQYNDLAAVEELVRPHRNELAAILIEPMQGTTGCIPADRSFLTGLRALAAETGRIADLRRGDDLALGAGRIAGGARHPSRSDDIGQICRRRHELWRLRRARRPDGALRSASPGCLPARRHLQQQPADDECRARRTDRDLHT
jgi:glutamate-1-semialdehyde 2,1-aminomutase